MSASACRATSPSSLPRAYLTGRPAVCCGVVLPVCPCVVSCSIFHESDTRDLLRASSRGSSRGCHEDTTRKRVPWNSSFIRCRAHSSTVFRSANPNRDTIIVSYYLYCSSFGPCFCRIQQQYFFRTDRETKTHICQLAY